MLQIITIELNQNIGLIRNLFSDKSV